MLYISMFLAYKNSRAPRAEHRIYTTDEKEIASHGHDQSPRAKLLASHSSSGSASPFPTYPAEATR